MTRDTVLIVGAGISGIACARALHRSGVHVRVAERGRVTGGRMASRRIDDRRVDLGAAYFTAPEDEGDGFHRIVDDWLSRGRIRPWTESFATAGPHGPTGRSPGPMRYAAPGGLRGLVEDLASPLDGRIDHGRAIERIDGDGAAPLADGEAYAAIVLALPDPQARRLLADAHPLAAELDSVPWLPTIAVALRYVGRMWADDLHGAFVDDESLSFVADDGDRRGDGAPVLVAHTSPGLAAAFLDRPDAVIPQVVHATSRSLGFDAEPESAYAHRWTFARPAEQHAAPFGIAGGVGACGDAWGPKSSVGGAWRSGDSLGRELAARIAD